MEWLSTSATVIGRFAGTHGIALAITGVVVALIMALPQIAESVYKRRPAILESKDRILATKAEGKVNKIRAISDQKASAMRLKQQARVLDRTKVETIDDAVKLLMAIHADPDQPEKRRLPDNVLGEIYTDAKERVGDTRNGPGTAPGKGSAANVRGLPKSAPS